jgi:ferric-dicitrate binding protein FerR (iron transport regulator)
MQQARYSFPGTATLRCIGGSGRRRYFAMRVLTRNFLSAVAAALACGLWLETAFAQPSDAGCILEQVAGTSRQVLRCQNGLNIIVEDGAGFTLVDRDQDGNADAVRLRRKALLLDGPQIRDGTGFQVVTPQAIAAVRGTKWAVDVDGEQTSVFVVSGSVAVQRPTANADVLLGPGEGVDVGAGDEPLTVRRWPAERVAALMARFGQ